MAASLYPQYNSPARARGIGMQKGALQRWLLQRQLESLEGRDKAKNETMLLGQKMQGDVTMRGQDVQERLSNSEVDQRMRAAQLAHEASIYGSDTSRDAALGVARMHYGEGGAIDRQLLAEAGERAARAGYYTAEAGKAGSEKSILDLNADLQKTLLPSLKKKGQIGVERDISSYIKDINTDVEARNKQQGTNVPGYTFNPSTMEVSPITPSIATPLPSDIPGTWERAQQGVPYTPADVRPLKKWEGILPPLEFDNPFIAKPEPLPY